MAAEEPGWRELIQAFLDHPEKSALFMVLIVGAWRWIRELLHSSKEDTQQETFMETLLRENKELRAELKEARRRNGDG